MKAYLMFRDRDFDVAASFPSNEVALVQDLELPTLLEAMSAGDEWLAPIVKKAVLLGTSDIDTILYRQNVLKDCIAQEDVVRKIYNLAVETLQRERKEFWASSMRSPNMVLSRCVKVLALLVHMLERLRTIADRETVGFRSEGFIRLFDMLRTELSDDYLSLLKEHLRLLQFENGVVISAQLGDGNRSTGYVLRKDPTPPTNWFTRWFISKLPGYSYELPERDESGALALSELRERGINLVANAVGQSTDHVLGFFMMLRTELAFYIGCLNLRSRLLAKNYEVCFPQPVPLGEREHSADQLYDVCLALKSEQRIVNSDIQAGKKSLVIITGANQGGKSTFLRAVGISQLMMQCGMYVAAARFKADVCESILTHYKREEDAEMNSGKFDEELSRMNEIVNIARENSLILFNESFAATNEREGSGIARQVVTALIDQKVKVFFVTHQYEFAHGFDDPKSPRAYFLRAERQSDGTRTFKLTPGTPLPTSFGEDLYNKIFKPEKRQLSESKVVVQS